MGEENQETPTSDAPGPVTDPKAEPAANVQPKNDGVLGEGGIKALQAERARAQAAEKRLKEYEDAKKTEAERQQDQLLAAQQTATSSALQLLKLQTALAHAPAGADPAKVSKLAGRLQGATPEELQADAKELFADFAGGESPGGGTTTTTPVEHMKPGAMPQTPKASLSEQIAEAETKGEWATAQYLKSQQLLELYQKDAN